MRSFSAFNRALTLAVLKTLIIGQTVILSVIRILHNRHGVGFTGVIAHVDSVVLLIYLTECFNIPLHLFLIKGRDSDKLPQLFFCDL